MNGLAATNINRDALYLVLAVLCLLFPEQAAYTWSLLILSMWWRRLR